MFYNASVVGRVVGDVCHLLLRPPKLKFGVWRVGKGFDGEDMVTLDDHLAFDDALHATAILALYCCGDALGEALGRQGNVERSPLGRKLALGAE